MTIMSVKSEMDIIIIDYIKEIKSILGDDCERAVIYGSYARNEYKKDSDIDIAIFTSREPQEFYLLINEISEVTFEYSVKYDVILSPVFQNTNNFKRMIKAVPYFQSIQREGMAVE